MLYLALPALDLFPVAVDTNQRVRNLEETVAVSNATMVGKIDTVEAKLDSTAALVAANAIRDSVAVAAYEAAKKTPVAGHSQVDFSTYTDCIRENNKLRQHSARIQHNYDSLLLLHATLPDRIRRRWAKRER